MRPLFLVPGTHGGEWTEPGSPCRLYLTSIGFRTLLWPWSYRTGGVPSLIDPALDADWIAGGWSGRFELHALSARGVISLDAVDVMTHSHGVNPVIFQTVQPNINGFAPVRIRNLISICAPPRGDMQAPYALARRSGMLAFHRAVYCDGWDFWARAGQAFDGSWGWQREWPGADDPVGLKDIGHSKLLTDPAFFERLGDVLEDLPSDLAA